MSAPEFQIPGFDDLRPGLQTTIRWLGAALRTVVQDEIERKKTDQLLENIGRPDNKDDQNALLAFGRAENDDNVSPQQAFGRHEKMIKRALGTMKSVKQSLNNELAMLSEEEKDRFKDLANAAIKDFDPLIKGADESTKWGLAAASTIVLGGSLAIITNSDENAYKVRAPTTNIMWGLEILTLALSDTSDAWQFFDALVMRFGVSIATQVVALIDIYNGIEAGAKKAAGIILPNLAVLFAHVLYPIGKHHAKSLMHQGRAKKTLRTMGSGTDAQVAKAYFDQKANELTGLIEELENEEKANPPENKTLGKVTAAKSSLTKLRDAFSAYHPAQPPTESPWIKRIEKIPSLTYAHVVAILQLVSALGNIKTLGDNSTFFVMILTFTWESFFNPSHSAVFMAGRLMRYSAGMAISFFTAGIHLLKDRAVFDKDPEFTRNMAIVTALLNLTIAVHFVPGFKLMTTWVVELIECIRRRQAARRAREVSGETVLFLEELDDEAMLPVDPNEYFRIVWGGLMDKMELLREKDAQEKALDDEEDAADEEVDQDEPNLVDMLSAADLTEEGKGATKDVISLFNIFLDPAAALDEPNEHLGRLRLPLI
ncbi:hypothetical protein [Ensifer sp. NM-2]|uniref:hypothetical protein n=1 Tax=Ensifer sp. NM-2 TaxID=2109730 RepID=UPI0011B23508|nr:hypothetical protein [Ensifer sp. NM-2]